MLTSKLSAKAATLLKSLPKSKKTYSIDKIVDLITKSEGLGKIIIQNTSPFFGNRKNVNVDLMVKHAFFEAYKLEHPFVGTEHLLLSLLYVTKSKDYKKVLEEVNKHSVFSKNIKNIDLPLNSPMLAQYSNDLTLYYLKNFNKKIVQREPFKLLVTALMTKNNLGVLVVGDPGVGRESLINLLALRTSSLSIPMPLIEHKVIEIDFLNFMLGNITKVGPEISLNSLVDELKSLGKVIVVLKNLENLFLSTSSGVSIPLAFSLFKNLLKENNIKIVAKLSTEIYEKVSSDQESALEGFSIVDIEEPTDKELFDIVKEASAELQDFHGVLINDEVIDYTIKKSLKILPELCNPKKSILILDLASALVNYDKNNIDTRYKTLMNKTFNLLSDIHDHMDKGDFESANKQRLELIKTESNIDKIEENHIKKTKNHVLITNDIKNLIQKHFSKNVVKNNKDLVKLSKLNKNVLQKIVGQDDAVNKIVKSLIRSGLGLKSNKRPLGNFLFLGPTGVGKTELAKVLSKSFFGENSLIRLDMSDFGEKHNVARLVGAPPGYIGYGDGGELTSKIASNPSSVVLFDEIEKAHPDVLNILLQIMDEGELKDAKGNTFSFSDAVIILTSNAGTNIVHTNSIGFNTSDIEHADLSKRLKTNLKKIMKPELLNRFDEIIIFKQLTKNDQNQILDLLINEVKQNLIKQKVTLKVSKQVKEHILQKGYSKEFGVRALRRVLETELLDVVADYLLNNYKKPLTISAKIKDDKVVVV